jgi:hypothetical protein
MCRTAFLLGLRRGVSRPLGLQLRECSYPNTIHLACLFK